MITQVLDDIPVLFKEQDFFRQIHLERYPDAASLVQKYIETVLSLIKPKAIFGPARLDVVTENNFRIEGLVFHSKIPHALAIPVDAIVFPYVVSCGTEINNYQPTIEEPLVPFWHDVLKEMVLYESFQFLHSFLRAKHQVPNLISMNPGSGPVDLWPIQEQKLLFQLIGAVPETIGVILTDSCLMIPNKSLSGIFLPSQTEFIACEFCDRGNCPNRRTPYRGDLFSTIDAVSSCHF